MNTTTKMTIGEIYDLLGYEVLKGNAGVPVNVKVAENETRISSTEERKYDLHSLVIENGHYSLVAVREN